VSASSISHSLRSPRGDVRAARCLNYGTGALVNLDQTTSGIIGFAVELGGICARLWQRVSCLPARARFIGDFKKSGDNRQKSAGPVQPDVPRLVDHARAAAPELGGSFATTDVRARRSLQTGVPAHIASPGCALPEPNHIRSRGRKKEFAGRRFWAVGSNE
jgi:hypothetical protein